MQVTLLLLLAVLFVDVNYILLFGNEVAHIRPVLQEVFSFLSVMLLANLPVMKRGLNTLA